ncbi:hypothetical protein SAMN05216574_107133 [Blastococcus tunisiensis]|uniref:Uncharacterized protein n=2 Tax=Blastococcus tunisiensis TaxID=1798228 RepID=A0A1I2ENW9_9ACTN|nr:hypothetical protein SAMN05216574_107133 [Blastococcus sp. DSM 46838]
MRRYGRIMRIRRTIAVLFTLTVLFSGSATLTACGSGVGTDVIEDTGNDDGENDQDEDDQDD